MPVSDREREQRVLLAAASEPGDPVTGSLIDRIGTEETLRLAQADDIGDTADLPAHLLVPWQERLVSRIRNNTVADIMARSSRDGDQILIPGDEGWPAGVGDLVDPPIVLFARGDTALLSRPLSEKITITGAQAATGYGEHLAAESAADLAQDNRVLVTGAGHGIEAASLRGTLAAGGQAIAILASGLDRVYPAGNEALMDRAAESGALVTELPPGAAPTRWRFLQRARLLAGLSAATVVVEAGIRSSTLHTVQRARDLGRQIGAFPGPVTSVSSAGPHELIAAGLARLVRDSNDIRQLLDPASQEPHGSTHRDRSLSPPSAFGSRARPGSSIEVHGV